MRLYSLLSICLPFLSLTTGFYKQGHELIGELTDNILDENIKERIGISVKEASPWADSIRWEKGYRWANDLHYIDTDDRPDENNCFVNSYKVNEGRNLYTALTNYTERLSNRVNRTEEDLKFFIHFYEDLFEPLHASGILRGGNGYDVDFFGRKGNLHQVWDYLIIRDRVQEIDNYLSYLINTTRYHTPYEPFNFAFWIHYNNKLNCEYVYNHLNYDVSKEYYDKNKYIVESLILTCAVNLKYILEQLYY